MKLLFDQNLSFKVIARVLDLFPGSAHVKDYSLETSDDEAIWNFARDRGFTIVSKDDDFHQRSFLLGHPPKVGWIRAGNCATETVAEILRRRAGDLASFETDAESSFLAISR